MPKKKSHRRLNPFQEPLQQFGEEPESADEIIEYAPDLSAKQALYDAEAAKPDEGLIAAKNELLGRLGGLEALAAAAATASSSDRIGAENIQAVGVGIKETRGQYTGDPAVKVFVREKLPLTRLAEQAVVPKQINGYPTDVEVIGEIYADSYARRYQRPVPCGVSVGHPQITAGTLGSLVVLNNNRLCILSNNHVLARSNKAQVGDPIVQPGASDGGDAPDDRVGVLERFVPIQFPGPNQVDAAAAWTALRFVDPEHVTYTANPIPLEPALAMTVVKNGRTTQATVGVITGRFVDGVRVNYRPRIATFNDQVVIRGLGGGPFSQGGDSGSLIVSASTQQPVGLLFAGSTTHTIVNPIQAVMAELGIKRFFSAPDQLEEDADDGVHGVAVAGGEAKA